MFFSQICISFSAAGSTTLENNMEGLNEVNLVVKHAVTLTFDNPKIKGVFLQ